MKLEQFQREMKEGTLGQATVELVLTLVLFFSIFLFFFQLAMIFAFGNYVHYATFMSARAYLSASQDQGDQQARARTVILDTLKQGSRDRFPFIARGVNGSDPTGFEVWDNGFTGPSSWLTGVRYTFQGRLFVMPLGGNRNGVNSVTLTSESFLGRSPSASECQSSISGIFDNGC